MNKEKEIEFKDWMKELFPKVKFTYGDKCPKCYAYKVLVFGEKIMPVCTYCQGKLDREIEIEQMRENCKKAKELKEKADF